MRTFCLATTGIFAATADPTTPRSQAVAACAGLNFTEKAGMMHGFGKIDGYSRNSGCGSLCGRATLRWDNGPQGFGDGSTPGSATQWPSTLNMGATFDPELANEWGTAMGEEVRRASRRLMDLRRSALLLA